jgi:MoxR-like ATPase
MIEAFERVRTEVGRVVVGQEQTVDLALVAACTGGHVLLEGPPGVAKTLAVNALSRALGLGFRRVQFTPDMLPSDVTGTMTIRGVRSPSLDRIEAVASAADLADAGAVIDETTVSDEVAAYLAALVRMTRELPAVELGASPRAAVHLLAASRAAARLAGRAFVTPDDVVAMAAPVLAHRLVLRPEAELERVTPRAAVAAAIAAVAVPR